MKIKRIGIGNRMQAGHLVIGWLMIAGFLLANPVWGQSAKVVNSQTKAWISLNSAVRLSGPWGAVMDFHVRRSRDFVDDPNFYLARAGLSYHWKPNLSLVAGYAHRWIASPAEEGWNYGHENRIYQQLWYKLSFKRVQLDQRVGNEQRWLQVPDSGSPGKRYRYKNRFRYLLALSYPLGEKPHSPRLFLSDEILLNYGPPAAGQPFDQNRFTLGLREKISEEWSFDLAYMYIWQERIPRTVFEQDHILRLFFYYTADWRKKK